jgi:hypothetical protein
MADTFVFPTTQSTLSIYYVASTEDATKHVTWVEHTVLRVVVSGVQGTEGTEAGEKAW